jgi:flagellar biosynthesis/type III secretory pathway protein FliH
MTIKRDDLSLLDLGKSGFNVLARIAGQRVRIMTLPRKVAKDEAQAEAILDWMHEGLSSMFEKGRDLGVREHQYELRALLGVPALSTLKTVADDLENRIEHLENDTRS